MTTLFIYGTLKRGQINHHLLEREQFLGAALTKPEFRLLKLGWYPGLARAAEGGQAVEGELWEVSEACLQRLDDYEGDEYARAEVMLTNGQSAETYLLKDPDWSFPDAGVRW